MNKQILNTIRIISILSITSPLCKASAAPSPYGNYKSYNLFTALISSSDDTKSDSPQDDDIDDTSSYKAETESSEKLTDSEYSTEKEIIGRLSLASSEGESPSDKESSEESDRSVSPFILNSSSSSDDEMNDSFVIFKKNVQKLQDLARGQTPFQGTFSSYRLVNEIIQYLNTLPIEIQAKLIDKYELVSLATYIKDPDLRRYCIEHMSYFTTPLHKNLSNITPSPLIID